MTPHLRCEDVADSIEALAAGELQLCVPGAAEHVRDCAACQRRVALARQLDAALAVAVPIVPGGFTARVVTRVRDEGRRRERLVDRIFNAAIVAAGVAVVAGVAALLRWTGMMALLGNVATLAGEGVLTAAGSARADSFLYIAGSLAGLTAFVMWRWSEGERFL